MTQHPGYELFEELGRGVNTVVYRAYDISLGRDVAIKELDESARRDPRHRERFLREAQFLAQFEHDNVLRVYTVDTERGWIVMELMKGTLASIIEAGPSDPDLVRSVLKQTLEALAFLHDKNKVHGTVRPTNLLINDAGRVKLSEFEHSSAGGELRAPKGSKKYLAPELIRPEFGEFGPPLDLYCLGFTALELLKGPQFESLFPGTGKGAIDADMAWLRWHSSPEEIASVKKLVKGVPDDLAHVLDRMLKKRVAERAQTAQEVLNELADRPLVAVPVEGMSEEEAAAASDKPMMTPGVVRDLGGPTAPTSLPPAAAMPGAQGTAASAGTKKPGRASGSSAALKPSAPRFSKEWWNQQLGRPYVLYPLCAVIILGAVWFSFFRGGPEGDVGASSVAVRFDVQPDATGLTVAEGETPVAAGEDGTFALSPGEHALTFRKEGYLPLTQSFDVSAERNTFPVKLEPEVKYDDVVVRVTPADAELTVDGKRQALVDGAYTHKLERGRPLALEAQRAGYKTVSRSVAPEELAGLNHQVTIELEAAEPEKPRLPAALVAKPGAEIDAPTQLPVRALSTALGDSEPMEFVLVKPGTYSYGATGERRGSELSGRQVQIEQPFYIAIHEATNSQYQKFFAARGASQAGSRWREAAEKWARPLKLDPTANHLPVTFVSLDAAKAFCDWMGGRLPTEIEWECAVRGPGDAGFPHPWGKEAPSRDRCQLFYGELGPVPVEQLPAGASPLGLMHALGNAAEWCQDGEQPGSFLLRGCSFGSVNVDDVRVTWRGQGNPQGEEDIGFRVVVPVGEAKTDPATMPAAAGETQAAAPLPTSVWMLTLVPWDSVAETLGLTR